jgi:hypothetical protein
MARSGSASPAAVLELSNLLPKCGQRTLDSVPIRVTGFPQDTIILLLADVPSISAVFPNGKALGVSALMELFRKHEDL